MRALPPLLLVAVALCVTPHARAEQVVRTVTDAPGQVLAVDGNATAYVADAASNTVTAIDSTGHTTHFAVGSGPRWIAAGSGIFVSNAGDGTMSVIPGNWSSAPATLALGGSGPIVTTQASSGTTVPLSKAYVVRREKADLAVVDGSTLAWHPVDAGGRVTQALAAGNNRLYASQPDVGIVRVIDISGDSTTPPSTDVAVPGRPGPIAYDANTNKVYVLTGDGASPLVEIDAATLQVRPLSLAGHNGAPRAIATALGRVFIGLENEFVIFDPPTGNVRAYPMSGVVNVVADSLSGNGYALDANGLLMSYLHLYQAIKSTQLQGPAYDVAFLYKPDMVYAATAHGVVMVSTQAGDLTPAYNAQGLWWVPNGAESGWGINITHQANILFATWFTYDPQGHATWLVMSSGRDSSRNLYSGTLYRTTGPVFSSTPFDPSKVTRTPVGTLSLEMLDFDNAMLTATVDGVTVTKPLGKQIFALPEVTCSESSTPGAIPNYTALWWASPAGSESGWGLNIAHQGDILFVTWFTYDGTGQPMWLVGSDVRKSGNNTYSGTLYTTAGPPLAAQPWDPSRVTRTPAGSVTLSFTDDDNGTFTYTVGGVTQSKAITRQVYATNATRCQ